MAKNSLSSLNFESAMTELESMVEKMAKGQLTLEESLKSFEEGISLARKCQQALKQAEQKVQILTQQNDQFVTQSFTEDE